jgi:NAD(P)H dehydrogenase (quinone)
MNNSPYGTIQNEDESKIIQTAEHQVVAFQRSTRQQNASSYSNAILLLLIFLCLSYLTILGHNILDELRDRNDGLDTSAHVWTADSVIPTSQMPLFDGYTTRPFDVNGTKTAVLIVYIPDDEGQLVMAHRVSDGVKSVVNTTVILESTTTASFDQVLEADAIILGSSVENGNTHPLLQTWINEQWNIRYDLRSKVGGAFVTAGGMSAGEEGALLSLIRAMLVFRMIVVGGDSWTAAFGASAVTAEGPFTSFEVASQDDEMEFAEVCYQNNDEIIHPIFLNKAYGLGVRVASVASRLRT